MLRQCKIDPLSSEKPLVGSLNSTKKGAKKVLTNHIEGIPASTDGTLFFFAGRGIEVAVLQVLLHDG